MVGAERNTNLGMRTPAQTSRMRVVKTTIRALLLLVALGVVRPAAATLAVPATVEELTRSSDAVVRGVVTSVESRWSRNHRRISTYVEVTVQDSGLWRGSAPSHLTVVVPGGAVGEIGQQVDGAATFTQGEEVVVFLHHAGAAFFQVNGYAQGKFSVAGASAKPDVHGMQFVRGPALRAGERRVESMGVDELERRVKGTR
jgi:hypothetical protein